QPPTPHPEPDPTPTPPDTPTTHEPAPEGTSRVGEDYLFDPDFRATAADRAALTDAITTDGRRQEIHQAAVAKRDAAPALAGLSDRGAFALYAYTGHDVFDTANTAHRLGADSFGRLDETRARQQKEAFERTQGQVREIVSAINELPPFQGELLRGIDVGGRRDLAALIAAQYQVGRTTVEPTIVSASIKDSPDFTSKFGEDVEIHIMAKTARDIHALSQNTDEKEAVGKPGTQWFTHENKTVVVERNGVKREKTIIVVEEVLPGDPRYLDQADAEREIAARREANNTNAAAFERATAGDIGNRLGGGAIEAPKTEEPQPRAEEPAQPERSTITDRLGGGGYAGTDHALDHTAPSGDIGGHDWSPLSHATNPPAEAAIHAGTANPSQAAKYLAEEHPHLAGVNPRYHDADGFESGYRTNCTRGVVAAALRHAGIDVEAGPLRPEDMETLGTLDHVQDRLGGQWQSHDGYDDVIRAMRDEPPGTRAVVAVKYTGPDGVEYGHVAEVVTTRHGVAFVDPQTNSLMSLPHPPTKVDLLRYDPAEAVTRHNQSTTDQAESTKDNTSYGAANPTPQETSRFLAEPRVQDALRVADAISHRDPDARITVDGEKLHIGEAIAALLPRHPELVGLLRDTPYLENSLLERPQTLANLLRHPEALDVLADCVDEVRRHDPESLADQHEAEPDPDHALLTEEQAAVSAEARDVVDSASAQDRRQPGFDLSRVGDADYRARYLDELYRDWSGKQARLHALADEVARATGGEAFSRQTEKSRVRAQDKVTGYRGEADRLTDLVGSKIQYRTVADAYRGLEVLLARLDDDGVKAELVDFDDRIAQPEKSGYRDLQCKVRLELDDGTFHVAELRLHLRAMDDVADFEHALFEVRRDFKALAKEDGRAMTAEQRALANSILARERELFAEAFRRSGGVTRDGRVTGEGEQR
ncbi:MAG: hypothetical protein HOY78_33565, partial [Saccharothrix sp.]|nr:hypothetical protein [Saccharothrix sp.]